MSEAANDPNAELKTRPVPSTDCEAGDHRDCAGEESALWPDGDYTMRKCSCPCHAAAPKFVAIDKQVKQGRDLTIARTESHNMAKRIANALNHYTPNRKGH